MENLKIKKQEEVVKFLEESLWAKEELQTLERNEQKGETITEFLEESLKTQRKKLDELKLHERKLLKTVSSVIISQETIANTTRDNLGWWADEIENGYVCHVLNKDFKNETIVEKLNLLEETVSYDKEELLLSLEILKNFFEKEGFSAKIDITGEYCISLFANEKEILAFSRYSVNSKAANFHLW